MKRNPDGTNGFNRTIEKWTDRTDSIRMVTSLSRRVHSTKSSWIWSPWSGTRSFGSFGYGGFCWDRTVFWDTHSWSLPIFVHFIKPISTLLVSGLIRKQEFYCVYSVFGPIKRQMSIIFYSILHQQVLEQYCSVICELPCQGWVPEYNQLFWSRRHLKTVFSVHKPRVPWYFQQVMSLGTSLQYCTVVFSASELDVISRPFITITAGYHHCTARSVVVPPRSEDS